VSISVFLDSFDTVHDYNPSSRTEYCIRIEFDRIRVRVCVYECVHVYLRVCGAHVT